MGRLALVIAVGLWGALALPMAGAANLPRTVEEQAEWCGDFFVARVCENCEAQVPEAIVGGPRDDLVRGMKATLSAPLTMGELVGFAQQLTADLMMCSPDRLPFELELRARVRAALGGLTAYLSEEWPPYHQGCEVLAQAGALLEFLQECLEEELAGIVPDERGVARTIGASVFSYAGMRIVREAESPFLPQYKRPLTQEQVEAMQERARERAREAREWREKYRTAPGNQGRVFPDTELALLAEVASESGSAAAQFVQDLMVAYGVRGPWLTPEERAELSTQYHALWAARAEERAAAYLAAPPLMPEEPGEVIMTPQGAVDARTGELLQPNAEGGAE